MISSGGLFYSQETHRFLFLLRNHTRTKDTWGMSGGKIHSDETVISGLKRELAEELGELPEIIKFIPLETFTSSDEGFKYHSFIFVIDKEFIPKLNEEHSGYSWSLINKYPKPLHPGLFQSINTEVIINKIKLINILF